MYGAIYGDLVGSVYEYDQSRKIRSINPELLLTDDSFYSDDTILTIAVLDAILHDRNYDYYIRKYIDDILKLDYRPEFEPYFDSPFSPGLIAWAKKKEIGCSGGNGALMRISPVGFMFDNPEEVYHNAFLATNPSHHSFEATISASTLALMIYYLRIGYSKEEVYQKLKLPVHYQPFKRFNMTCYETLENCLYVFYQSSSFEDAIRKTLLMGGDTDTNAAIVGSMAEALYGIDDSIVESVQKKLPKNYVKVLEKAFEYGYR